jgi:hypothetical protein
LVGGFALSGVVFGLPLSGRPRPTSQADVTISLHSPCAPTKVNGFASNHRASAGLENGSPRNAPTIAAALSSAEYRFIKSIPSPVTCERCFDDQG